MSSPDAPDLDALHAAAGIYGRLHALTTGVAGGDHWYICDEGDTIAYVSANDGEDEKLRQPRAELIAASVNAVPALIAALRAAETKLAAIHTEHQPDGDYGYSTQCTACGTMWPCNTDAILNGKGEPT